MTEPVEDLDQNFIMGGPNGNAETVAALGAATAEPHVISQNEAVSHVLPPGYKISVIRGDQFSDVPSRVQPRHQYARDEQSFIALVQDLTNANGTQHRRVYADPADHSVVAVINDDAWRDVRVQLQLVHTPEWSEWTAKHDKYMPQREFMEFLEDHMVDVATPDSATLYEIVSSLEGTTSTAWASAQRLSNGNRKFVSDETTTATAGEHGDLEIPEKFVLRLAPWAGKSAVQPFAIDAMFRYRIENRQLRLGYHLQDVDRILDESFKTDILAPIEEALGEVIAGTP